MTFEADLRSHLRGDAGITALVGERIRAMRRTDSAVPAITFQRVIGIPQNDLDGLDGALMDIRTQIDVYGPDFDAVRALAELVRIRLQTPAATFHAVTNFDQDFFEDDVKLYRTMLDCSFWFRTS